MRNRRGEPPGWFRWAIWLGMAASAGLAVLIAGSQ